MPQLICGRLTSLNVSHVHKFPLGRQVEPSNFCHGRQIKRDAVLFLGCRMAPETNYLTFGF